MIKKLFSKFPLWFIIIWFLAILTYIIFLFTGKLLEMMGLLIVLYIANVIRTWKSERGLAITSFILAIVFSYILYKFLML